MKKVVAIVSIGLLALALGGCSPVPSDPRAVLEEKAAAIDGTIQDLFDVLHKVGLDKATGSSEIGVCQSEPAPGVSYDAGMTVDIGTEPASGYNALVTELEAAGWKHTTDLGGTEQAPMGRYKKGDITLDIKTGGFTYAGKKTGEDEMTIKVWSADYCVRVPHGTSFTEFQDLEKEFSPTD